MKRSIILFLTVFIIVGLLLSFSTGQKDKLSMVIGYIPHVQFTPLYVAMQKGFLDAQNIDLSITYGFSIDAYSLIVSNKIDCTLADSDQLLVSREKGLPLRAFYQYYQDYPVSIVALGNIVNPQQLIGKKIGVPEFAGTSYIGALLFLYKYQLENKVELVKIGYSQIPSLITKKVDAVVCFYNNEPVQLKNQGYQITEWRVKDFSRMVGAAFISSDSLLNGKNDLFRRFVTALNGALKWTAENRDDALSIAFSTINNLKPEDRPFWKQVLDKTIELYSSPDGYGSLDNKRYDETIGLLMNLNLLMKKQSAQDILFSFGK